jgi:hypothetical protein
MAVFLEGMCGSLLKFGWAETLVDIDQAVKVLGNGETAVPQPRLYKHAFMKGLLGEQGTVKPAAPHSPQPPQFLKRLLGTNACPRLEDEQRERDAGESILLTDTRSRGHHTSESVPCGTKKHHGTGAG